MNKEIVPVERVASLIFVIRDQRVILDADLADLYGVSTGHLNRAVKRNAGRFPADFMFQINAEELDFLKCQIGISKPGRGGRRRSRPFVFTEQGIAMLSSVLNSERAVRVNIAIMRTFVRLRQMLETNRELADKFSQLEQRVDKHDEKIAAILEAIRQLIAPPLKRRREIGFHVREHAARYRTRKRT
jgi:ORF6N domain-containing protein